MMAGIVILIVTIGIIYFVFHIDTVHVEGSEYYTETEIKNSVFSKKYSDNVVMFWLYERIFGINTLPFVEEIDVEYDGPRSVTLHVYDKTISGCIKYMGQYVYFDKDGIVLQTLSEQREGIPVVTGITFGKFTVGEAFYVEDSSVFDSIKNISQLIEHYGIEIKQIHVKSGELILYSGQLEIYMGKKKMYDDAIAALAATLDKGKQEKLNLQGTIHMENFEAGDRVIVKKSKKSTDKKSKQDKKSEK